MASYKVATLREAVDHASSGGIAKVTLHWHPEALHSNTKPGGTRGATSSRTSFSLLRLVEGACRVPLVISSTEM
eukprot:scaffold4463_cov60-Phaeocystis_antarctica.AAC.3